MTFVKTIDCDVVSLIDKIESAGKEVGKSRRNVLL